MASVGNIRPLILKWEGGLSRDTADNASSYPAPWEYKGLTGWHTNKGITYKTFSSFSSKLGYANTADNFFNMPNSIWDKIFKVGYWETWHLDSLHSQAIANLIFNMSWGSGVSGSLTSVKKYLLTKNITVTNTAQAVAAINKLAILNETSIFLELIKWREDFFRSLSDFAYYGKGWLKRLSEMKQFGLDTITKKKIKVAAIVIVLIVVIAISFTFYKRN